MEIIAQGASSKTRKTRRRATSVSQVKYERKASASGWRFFFVLAP
jgi:hypothetical protein